MKMQKENYDILLTLEKDNWWYRARRDLLFNLLKNEDRRFEKCLDVGCGVGSNYPVLKNFSLATIGIDNSKRALTLCKKCQYDNLINRSATDLGFQDGTFDLAICTDVLEHIDDKTALGEIARILKKQGTLIFSVPAHRYLWGPTDIISRHKRRYEKEDLNLLLKPYFEIEKLAYWNLTAFIPNLMLIILLKFFSRNKKSLNTLELTPRFLNEALYQMLKFENKIFLKYDLVQGVSIVGVCKRK